MCAAARMDMITTTPTTIMIITIMIITGTVTRRMIITIMTTPITITAMGMRTIIRRPAMCMAPTAITITITTAMTTGTVTSMTEAGIAELPLFIWLSPAFPVGAFAYSHALEWAAEAGDLADAAALQAWLEDLCDFGGPRLDAGLFAAAFRAANDSAALAEVNELAVALAGSAERRLETTAQGGAFVVAARAAWDCAPLACFAEGPVAYPVAVGATCAGHGFSLSRALPAFAASVFANLVSAAVRLSVIGQTDGQRLLAALMPRIRALAAEAEGAELASLGGCAFRSDLASLQHETQYSRLFRS